MSQVSDTSPEEMGKDTTDKRQSIPEGCGAPTGQPRARASVPYGPYKMNHKKRGMAIIINNKKFEAATKMNERRGTDVDADNLCARFKDLKFDVHVFNDRTVKQMKKIMHDESQRDHKDSDAFVCAMLSHGDDGVIYGVDGIVAIDDLVAPFKGKLAGKPKLFFIQACRGDKLDDGTTVKAEAYSEASELPDMEKEVEQRIPAEADFLMAYSVVPGYFAWRNEIRGSWFCQALCQVLEEYGHSEEIMRLMTRVNHKVAYEYESNAAWPYMSNKKQVPCMVTMLTKDLYFG